MLYFRCIFLLFFPACIWAQMDPLAYVNPFIGTAAHGHTFPGATAPFGLVQLSPDTRLEGWDGCSGYHYSDSTIYGFSHTHLSGTGVPDYCDVLFQPFTGAIPLENTEYASPFRKSTEKAEAGYYAVTLDKYRIRAEMTATAHTGVHRYTFPANRDKGNILIDLRHRDLVLESSMHIVNDREVEGSRISKSWAPEQKLYFVTRFSRPFFNSIALDMASNPRVAERNINSKAIVGIFSFYNAAEPLVAVTGISAISIEDARNQILTECNHFDFDKVKNETQAIWRTQLSKIMVEGGTPAQKTTFYTALYHTMCVPNQITTNPSRYSVFSLWDTYRAAHPLYTLLEPERTHDFIRSFLEHYQKNGRLPVWALWQQETDCMIGNHSIAVIADAYIKGLRNYDTNLALQAMRDAANQNRFGLNFYRQYGYVPANMESESVSKTLEYAYDDWCIAQMAAAMGNKTVAEEFSARAQYYKNIFNDATGFFQAKNNTLWHAPFDPTEVNFNYTEANAWQYRFAVPQDISGLMRLRGGAEGFAAALDSLFTAKPQTSGRDQVDITGLIGQYAHGNEPSHHVAYLYNYAGQPWKTQQRVRQIMDELYTDQPDGLSGNEDCGQMSAWYVFSAMGFYPVVPGRPEYAVGTPLFEKITLKLDNGKTFIIQAPGISAKNYYLQQATLNGQPLSQTAILHQNITAGGTLVFTPGNKPADWGKGTTERPVSAIEAARQIVPVPYLKTALHSFQGKQNITLDCIDKAAAIYYALKENGKTGDFKRYTKAITIDKTTEIVFYGERDGQRSTTDQARFYQIPSGMSVQQYHTQYNPQYTGHSNLCLIDGLRGGPDFRTGGWQGFEGKDLDVTLDLGQKRTIRRVAASFLQDENAWIFYPKGLSVSVSADGKKFVPFGTVQNTIPPSATGILLQDLSVSVSPEMENKKFRYVRVTGTALGFCPPDHKGAGYPGWLFTDEVVVE
jgi:predicted alpha-1,2-mannosidase